MEPRHHLKSPVELFTHCFHHRSAFPDDESDDEDDLNLVRSPHQDDPPRKRNSNPAVTLFYDLEKNLTVAVLSSQATAMNPLAIYLKCRVRQGTALERSMLYYELSGFIRENYSNIQRESYGFIGSGAISIAVGSLEASDEAQKKMLEDEQRLAREQRLVMHSAKDTSSVLDQDEQTLLFEQAMEIARFHRLNDDLDVLSVYFLRQVNKTCARIATRIAQYQLANCTTLMISPFVDGVPLSGYSNFNRGTVEVRSSNESRSNNNGNAVVMNALNEEEEGDDDEEEEEEEADPANELQQQRHHRLLQRQVHQSHQQLVRHREFGREIEYRRCKDIVLTGTRKNPSFFSPVTLRESERDDGVFSWDCEEVAFAVMHRWWGDIAEREYMGQKLVLSWLLRPSSSSSLVAATTTSLPLGTIHLEPHSSKVKGGAHQQHFPISLASRLTLDILHSHTKVIDDVTVSYKGQARVCHVQVNFLALVRAAARHVLDGIQQDYRCIQESRPLLDHERAYLRRVQDAASL